MSEPRLITDHKWKQFRYRSEVPPSVLADEFDWLDEDGGSDNFIFYRRTWYHLSQFEARSIEGYDGVHCDSCFSGVLIRVSKNGEEYQVATYIS